MLLSVIIPTKNEAANIRDCIREFSWAVAEGTIDVIVVDNFSPDGTAELAKAEGARVVSIGPERSAQRNHGATVEATGEYVLFVDADMRVGREVVQEILCLLRSSTPPDALYVRECMVGTGFWVAVRNFERSFYDATCIDGLRVIRRDILKKAGGFDVKLYAGEDWDLDRRILALTDKVGITKGALLHNEGEFSFSKYLKKKKYYAGNFDAYCRKWNYDGTIRKQFGLRYRMLTVFLEKGKWKRFLSRPHYVLAIWFYKALVGFVFFVGTRQHPAAKEASDR